VNSSLPKRCSTCCTTRDAGWERRFQDYAKAREQRAKVEQAALKAVSGGGEGGFAGDEFAALRAAGAIAKILRLGAPVIGNTGETLAKAFAEAGIKAGAEAAAALRARLEDHLRQNLKNDEYALFANPHETLARALAAGLHSVAERRPLLVVLDTYEIVDRADLWVREIVRFAGPDVVWVIGGRDDLSRDRGDFGGSYFRGYAADFPRRLVPYDVRRLALDDLHAYFAAAAPGRPLDGEAAEAINRATRGIPLAVCEAADVWAAGASTAELVGDIADATPHKDIVGKMTARYFLHAVQPQDRRALYALSLAGGDADVLRAMLHEDGAADFDLSAALAKLRRDYASVHSDEARLQEEPALFLRERLKTDPVVRGEAWCKAMFRRAGEALRARRERREARLPHAEDRCEDEDWLADAIALCRYLFWLDEDEAWGWLLPRFVEGLAYSRNLLRGLLEAAAGWKDQMSKTGKRWLKALQAGDSLFPGVQDEAEMLAALDDCRRAGWLKGKGEDEREAILSLKRGQLRYRQERYEDALAEYQHAERLLPMGRSALKKQLAEALYTLSGKFLWPDSSRSSVPSENGLRAAELAVILDRTHGSAHDYYPVALNNLGQKEKAIEYYQHAIELDPQLASPHHGLTKTMRHIFSARWICGKTPGAPASKPLPVCWRTKPWPCSAWGSAKKPSPPGAKPWRSACRATKSNMSSTICSKPPPIRPAGLTK
jgi:tetratricopeptide (TPR) repeat protein